MLRTFALSMTNPHETLGLPQPLARRLPQGVWAWNALFLLASVVFCLLYVFQVNAAASKGYSLRNVEKRVESLKTEAMVLQDKMVSLSSMQAVSARATAQGFVPVDQLQFVSPSAKAFAVAK